MALNRPVVIANRLPAVLKAPLMKTTIVLPIIFLISLHSFGQKPKLNITVDERIETLYSVAYLNVSLRPAASFLKMMHC